MCQLFGLITCGMQLESNEIQKNSMLLFLICNFGNRQIKMKILFSPTPNSRGQKVAITSVCFILAHNSSTHIHNQHFDIFILLLKAPTTPPIKMEYCAQIENLLLTLRNSLKQNGWNVCLQEAIIIIYVMAMILSVAKSTRFNQDVGFKFVIQHGMNNGFGP